MPFSEVLRKVAVAGVGLLVAGFAASIVAPEWFGDEFGRIACAEPSDQIDLVRAIPRDGRPDRWPGLLRRIAELEGGESLASTLLAAVVEADLGHVDPVLEAYRDRFPDSISLPAWTIDVRIAQGRIDEAVVVHRRRLVELGSEGDGRRNLVRAFAQQMAAAGYGAEALAAAEPRDAEDAFRAIAEALIHHRDGGPVESEVAPLRGMVQAYEARCGRTGWSLYYTALADEGAGDYESALRRYDEAARAVQGPVDDPDPMVVGYKFGRIQSRRTACLLHLGRWEAAYDGGPTPDLAFHVVARHLDEQGSVDDLARLIERHRGRASTVRDLLYWRAVVLWKRDAYAEALALLDEYLGESEEFGTYTWQAVERKFHGLLQVGRVDEARHFLEEPLAARRPERESWKSLLAEAVAGTRPESPPPGAAAR